METAFHGLEFLTAPGRVFTPRRTTEALVDAALAHVGDGAEHVADVGTGSGAIGVTIAMVRGPGRRPAEVGAATPACSPADRL